MEKRKKPKKKTKTNMEFNFSVMNVLSLPEKGKYKKENISASCSSPLKAKNILYSKEFNFHHPKQSQFLPLILVIQLCLRSSSPQHIAVPIHSPAPLARSRLGSFTKLVRYSFLSWYDFWWLKNRGYIH